MIPSITGALSIENCPLDATVSFLFYGLCKAAEAAAYSSLVQAAIETNQGSDCSKASRAAELAVFVVKAESRHLGPTQRSQNAYTLPSIARSERCH